MKIFLKGVKEFIKVIISIYLTNSFNLISKIPFISPGDAFATCLALYMIFIDLLLEYISEKITSYKCNLEIVFYQKDTVPEITSIPKISVNKLGLSEINMIVSFNGNTKIIKKAKIKIPQNSFFTIQSNGEIAYVDDEGSYVIDMSKLVQGSGNIEKEFLISFTKDTYENLGGNIEIKPELVCDNKLNRFFINLQNNKFKITL